MTEDFLAFTQTAAVCVDCYRAMKARHSRSTPAHVVRHARTTFPHPDNWYEEAVLRNLREYGWHFTHVFGNDEGPSFSYSVGLVASYSHPEIILCGLPQEAAHGLVDFIASRAADGSPMDLSSHSPVVIQGYACVFVEVTRKNREEYALSNCWLYGSSDFPMFQLVWSSGPGVFPWHPDASESFRWSQPVLGDVGGGA